MADLIKNLELIADSSLAVKREVPGKPGEFEIALNNSKAFDVFINGKKVDLKNSTAIPKNIKFVGWEASWREALEKNTSSTLRSKAANTNSTSNTAATLPSSSSTSSTKSLSQKVLDNFNDKSDAGSPPHLRVAKAYIGLKNERGTLSNEKLQEWNRLYGNDPNDTGWCDIFLNGVMEETAKLTGDSRTYRRPANNDWQNIGRAVSKSQAQPGDIIYLPEATDSSGQKLPAHVALVADVRPNGEIVMLGGNQGFTNEKYSSVSNFNLPKDRPYEIRRLDGAPVGNASTNKKVAYQIA